MNGGGRKFSLELSRYLIPVAALGPLPVEVVVLGPLAFPSRSIRSRKCPNLTLNE